MARKKADFEDIKTSPVYSSIAQATADDQTRKPRKDDYTEEEKREALETMQTTGKKGLKLKRINVAFSEQNYNYVKTMAAARGQSLTAFINHIIDLSLQENKDLYQEALEFRKKL